MISYAKLRSGAWGIRSDRELTVGATVSVTTRAGAVKSERVATLVWSGQGMWLYATAAVGSSPRSRSRGARYCEGWGADNPHAPRPPYTCHECGGGK